MAEKKGPSLAIMIANKAKPVKEEIGFAAEDKEMIAGEMMAAIKAGDAAAFAESLEAFLEIIRM